MVADAWHLVVGDGDRARIEKLSIDEPADHDTVAISDGLLDRLAQALREAGHAGQDIVLGLPSQWCYSASVSTDGLPRRDRRQALGYRLEEKLPVALEELTVDFVDTDQPTVLGVAVSTARLAPLIRGLEARNIPVQAALPTALLAPPGTLGSPGTPGSSGSAARHEDSGGDERATATTVSDSASNTDNTPYDVVLIGDGDAIDLFLLRDGRPTDWMLLNNPAEQLPMQLGLQLIHQTHPLHVRCVCEDESIRASLAQLADVTVSHHDAHSPLALAAAQAIHVAGGGREPMLNLRRGSLAITDPMRQFRRPLNVAVAAMMLCALAWCGAMLWRANSYEAVRQDALAAQAAEFRKLYPGERTPPNVKARLESDHRWIQGVRGQSVELPDQASALVTLHEALRRLPRDLRYRLDELRLGEKELFIEGQARTPADADRIAAALRAQVGFEVGPPQTERHPDQGVSFTLTGTLKEAASPQLTEARTP